ncbi:sestrin-3 [Phymastichus coffea]|uniref:sestrin-3 n=1 Tax=Phymastichus coffea TaxID=108790 RepID=UPI00273BC7AE|nr:sestrin-3 [Phymastichus coffea]
MSSRRGDEVEMVSRFLAPLCARDEAARNIALAAARTTVEGWLGGVGSPNNNWESALLSKVPGNASQRAQARDSLDGFFPQSVKEGSAIFGRKASFDDRYPSFDCVDGKLKDAEARFSSSADTDRRLFPVASDACGGFSDDADKPARGRPFARIKSGRQKLFDEEDELDADTKVYGKSPKFDIDFGNRLQQQQQQHDDNAGEKIVFNTLDGFLNDGKSSSPEAESERKLSAGQIKRPLSLDEDVPWKSNRVAEVVTPGDVGRMLNLGNALDGPRHVQANKYLSMVSLHLPVILRLSVNCPFENVRIKCSEIIQMIKDRGLPVPEPAFDGPSAFVPVSELPDLNNLDEKTHVLLMDAFLQNNRLDHVSRVMSSHPTYLDHFLRTQNFILRGDGPLPYDYRHLIAIMAAGRHQCSYLINLQKTEFLNQSGDETWLQGLKSIPRKLQNLYEINKILAHRPWLLNKVHIEKLTKGADSWSLAEVVHAIVLLAHFHSLSSFVFSCGINEELDNALGHHYKENIQANSNVPKPLEIKLSSSPKRIPNGMEKDEKQPSPPSSPSILGEQEVGVETLMERMKRLSEKSGSYQITQEELSKRFETVETQSAELAAAPQRSSSVLDSDIGLFIEDPTFIYQDFAKRGQLNDIPTFRVQDYSWDDHGYSLVNRLYNDVGNLLDDKFKTAYNLTYYTMGTHNKVDTSRFRRAIWNYIQCMFGIRHDDYDYNEVNQLLERSLKTFIKSAVCYPERVTKRDYDRVMREFKHSEKVHVNLMILEARMQAELLYALRAVMRYMT